MTENTPCALRNCFDRSSSEWRSTTLEEKISVLKKLINKDGENTLKLSVGMYVMKLFHRNNFGCREISLICLCRHKAVKK